jgi:hypothetical protein
MAYLTMAIPQRPIGSLLGLVLLFISTTDAFVVKKHVATMTSRAGPSFVAHAVLPPIFDVDTAATSAQPSFLVSDVSDTVMNVFLVISGILAVLTGLAFLLSTFIIPMAAKQIEIQAKELDPALWQEYQSKLEPGEVLAMRPDLMQELGNKVQALALAKFDEIQEQANSNTVESSSNSTKPPPNVMDAEVMSNDWEDK